MNEPPTQLSDRKQLPDAPDEQRVAAQPSSAIAAPPAASKSESPSSIPLQQPHGSQPPMKDGKKLLYPPSQPVKTAPVAVAPIPPKLDPMHVLGAAAVAHQQQQLQNATILRSLMNQKEQITRAEDEIRRRMLLPPSNPLLQAPLVQSGPGRFLSSLGLMGNIPMPLALGTPPLAAASLGLAPQFARSLTQGPNIQGDFRPTRGGVIEPFPEKLHRLLLETEAAGKADIISFVGNGRAFMIHKPERFFKEIVPLYFNHKRLSSFKRQLNLYSFELISSGENSMRGAYYHKLFVKDKPELCANMRRSVTSKAYSKIKRPNISLEELTSTTSADAKPAPTTADTSEAATKAPPNVEVVDTDASDKKIEGYVGESNK